MRLATGLIVRHLDERFKLRPGKYYSSEKMELSANPSIRNRTGLIASSVILFNTFTWFYIFRAVLRTNLAVDSTVAFFAVFDAMVILSGILGALVSKQVKRSHILYSWITVGIIATIFAAFLDTMSFQNLMIAAFFFGFSFGFGIPSGLAYFADCTKYENRGSISGLLFMLSIVISFVFFGLLGDSRFWILTFSAVWRIVGLLALVLLRPKKVEMEHREATMFRSILGDRSFVLYIIPWLLFCLVDNIEKPYFISLARSQGSAGEAFIALDEFLEPLIGIVFAAISGFVADRIGRKKVVLYGFIALGIAFAALSVAPTFPAFWYITSAIDGIAWGVFYVMFVLVLWGDISQSNSIREKYFALGGIPFFFAEFVGALAEPFAQNVSIQTIYAAFPMASFFLFLAVVPLMYAPETLPEKKLKERELKQYLEKAKKVKGEYV